MQPIGFIGWDLGGAHLKLAEVNPQGQLVHVQQIPCPLWKGLQSLDEALAQARVDVRQKVHAVTMTGELADIFKNRQQGVHALVSRMQGWLAGTKLWIFAGRVGMLSPSEVREHAGSIASANWLATASHAAKRLGQGILIDIGSTTTDIVPLVQGRVIYRGYSDGERLASQELLYTGVVRTPVMAVVREIPFAGEWHAVAAERFAIMGDVYSLTGQLEDVPSFETADGAGTEAVDCARRLARMVGRDVESAHFPEWQRLAQHVGWAQLCVIRRALARHLSRGGETQNAPFAGAGVGRFLAQELAAQMGHPYIDFSELCEGPEHLRDLGAICAPAVVLAYLVRNQNGKTENC